MQWRKKAIVGGAVGGAALGAAAAYNAVVAKGIEPLENPLGGEPGDAALVLDRRNALPRLGLERRPDLDCGVDARPQRRLRRASGEQRQRDEAC